jgi:uncharacterized membrane protein
VAPRREEVRVVYESENTDETTSILRKYNVSYIIVGTLERQKFTALKTDKFRTLGKLVFTRGGTEIYEVYPSY